MSFGYPQLPDNGEIPARLVVLAFVVHLPPLISSRPSYRKSVQHSVFIQAPYIHKSLSSGENADLMANPAVCKGNRIVTKHLGYYCDPQSPDSENAIIWSFSVCLTVYTGSPQR